MIERLYKACDTARFFLAPGCLGLVMVLFFLVSCGGVQLSPETAYEVPRAKFSVLWRAWLNESTADFVPQRFGDVVCVADNKSARMLNFSDGRQRAKMTERGIAAGAGCGEGVAVVNNKGELVVGDENGDELWRERLAGSILARPIIADGRIFVLGLNGVLSAYPVRRQERLWQRRAAQENPSYRVRLDSTPIFSEGILYVGQGGGRLGAVRATDGEVLWDVLFAEPRSGGAVANIVDVTTPVVAGDAVCAAAFQSVVGCVSRVTGELLWSKPLSAQFHAVAAESNGQWRLFVLSQSGELSAFSVNDGFLLWQRDGGDIQSMLLAAGGAVIGADATGVLWAFADDDGRQLDFMFLDGSPITGLVSADEQGEFFVQTTNGMVARILVSPTIRQ